MISLNDKKVLTYTRSITIIVSFIVLLCIMILFFGSLGNVFLNIFTGILLVFIMILFCLFYLRYKQTKTELTKSDQKLNSIFDSLDVAIWSHDLKTNNLLISTGIQRLYGYSKDEFYQDKELWKKVIHREDIQVLNDRAEILQRGEACTSIYRIIKPNGDVRWIQDRGIPTINEKGELIYFTSVLFDITDRKESEGQYQSLVEMSPDIIAVLYNGRFEYINKSGILLFGATDTKQIINKELCMFICEEDLTRIKRNIDGDFVYHSDKHIMELKIKRLDLEIRDIEISLMPILYKGKMAMQVIGRDITSRKKSETLIHNMAFYDSLTGLPNRNSFIKRLEEIIVEGSSESFAVLFLDLDRFKVINDTKGHSTGDLILREVANRLNKVVPENGEVFRQGGDEFLIILKPMRKGNVVFLADQILHTFTRPFKIDHQEFFVTPSIGVSMYPEDGLDPENLIKHADTAMYLAKEKGKNNFQFYYRDLEKVTFRKMELENALRRSMELNQFSLFYQPKIDLRTRKILGVEALIRWVHPELGTISPGEFIPLAEETGLIVPIGKWVLREACEQSKRWEQKGFGSVPVAVNISVRQLQDDEFIKAVKKIIDDVGINPSLLELEITESIMQNFERSTRILRKLKQLGVDISMDDFGTGYSSLSNLRYLPIDSIKIDKSFVDDIRMNGNGSIVKAIIDMGINMNFSIIAEGIETAEQVTFLLNNSCHIGQGYYFNKPLPVDELEQQLKANLLQEK